nr:hypothetical protein [Rhodobacter sp. TJ_12]
MTASGAGYETITVLRGRLRDLANERPFVSTVAVDVVNMFALRQVALISEDPSDVVSH